jgi:hypothetical protein
MLPEQASLTRQPSQMFSSHFSAHRQCRSSLSSAAPQLEVNMILLPWLMG